MLSENIKAIRKSKGLSRCAADRLQMGNRSFPKLKRLSWTIHAYIFLFYLYHIR